MEWVVIMVERDILNHDRFDPVFAQADQSGAKSLCYFDKSMLVNNRHRLFVNNHHKGEAKGPL